jgi:hypothetical protein
MLQVIFHKVWRREERPGRFPVYHVSAVGCLSTPIKSTRSVIECVKRLLDNATAAAVPGE